ncbi:hypothetical protein IIY59_02485 [Candidatus Saccharibacteria bacterium]|nr:hypothetical protein [Candidatus Saccharibacteria bacterium]
MDDDYLTDGSSALDPDYDDSHYTSGSDPNKEVLQSAKDDIRPKLQVIEGGGQGNSENDSSDSTNKPNFTVFNGGKSSPAKVLGSAEKNASQLPLGNVDSDSNDTKADARTNESIGNNGFINNATGKLTNSKATRKGFLKGRGNFKKRAPLMLLALLLGGGGIGIYSSQAILPFALVNRIKQEFNSQHVSLNRRYKYIFNRQLRTNLNKKNTSFLGHLRLTKKQKKFLKKQNIEVKEVEAGGSKHNILIVHNDDGTSKIVTGNSKKFNAALEKKMSGSDAPKFIKELKLSDTKPVKFKEALKTDENFTNRFVLGSKPVAGHVSGWFDSLFSNIRKRIGVTRNRWLNFDRREDEGTRTKKYEATAKVPDEKLNALSTEVSTEKEETDDDGNTTHTKEEIESGKNKADTKVETETNIKSKLEAASKVGDAGNIICTAFNIIGTINAIKYAAEMVQTLNYTSGFLESIQKTQVEEGDSSAMAEYLNTLSKKDANGLSGLSAEGIGELISGSHVDTGRAYTEDSDDALKQRSKIQAESALKFNPDDDRAAKTALQGLKGMKYTIETMRNCNYVRAGAAVISIAATFFTGGLSKIGQTLLEVAGGAAVQAVLSSVISFMVPKVAELLVRDLVTGVVGPDLGNALAAGANIYLSKNHQGAGGSPGDQEAVFAFKREQNIVLAEEARAERSIKSPLDVTTNSTFLGNVTYSLLPLATSFTSISNTVTNLSNIVASSTTKLLPSATAAGETQLISQAGDCSTINSTADAMADAYCNPYFVSDLDTTEMDPKMLTYAIWEKGKKNFQTTEVDGHTEIEYDQFGNPIINSNLKESRLLRYREYCGKRDSIFGTADMNITNSINDESFWNTSNEAVNTITDNIPIVGDLKDIFDAIKDNQNSKWISGEICINSKKNKDWEEMRYYQRFLEDQRLYENADIVEQSSGQTASVQYAAEYNQDNNSSLSLIARFSGLTENVVSSTLDVVDYYNFVAEYDPSSLYPLYENKILYFFGTLFEKNTSKDKTPISTLSESPIYVDLRNRNFGI